MSAVQGSPPALLAEPHTNLQEISYSANVWRGFDTAVGMVASIGCAVAVAAAVTTAILYVLYPPVSIQNAYPGAGLTGAASG